MLNFYDILRFIVLLSTINVIASQDNDYPGETEDLESLEDDRFPVPPIPTPTPAPSNQAECLRRQNAFGNCTMNALARHNLTSTILPLSTEIDDWCTSIKVLTQCDPSPLQNCSDAATRTQIEETLKGIQRIRLNVCDNMAYLQNYKKNSRCVAAVKKDLEYCLNFFQTALIEHRKTTIPWTHYENHFYLCCERALFRRCTLVRLSKRCNNEEVFILQKFIVVISERDFNQDCELSIDYSKCPGGDPRPNPTLFQTHNDQGHYRRTMPSKATNLAYGYLHCFWNLLFLCIFC